MKDNVNILVIGGSAGSYSVVRKILEKLPGSFHIPVVLCLHRLRDGDHGLCESLNTSSVKKVVEADDKTFMRTDTVYLAPSNYHLVFNDHLSISLTDEEPVNYSRPSIDITLESAAQTFGRNMIAMLLSGANADGAVGLKRCAEAGACTIVQDPGDALFRKMPESALDILTPDLIAGQEEIISFMVRETAGNDRNYPVRSAQ